MEKDLHNILSDLKSLLPLIKNQYEVKTIEIFGSYVRNEQNFYSDLDILVSFNKNPGLLKFLELKNYLSDMLKMKVDLVMKDSLKPGIRQKVMSESIAL